MSDANHNGDENIGSFYMERMRPPPQPERRLPTGLLTAAVLLALAGIIWYAYPRGAERYSDIDVPVVKADTAPIKAMPAEPGGLQVPHQDSTVFNSLEKKPAETVEKLRPAPEEPVDKRQAIAPAASKAIAAAPAVAAKDAAAATAAASKAATTAKPVTAAAGGQVYIQLGAYRDTLGARRDWEVLKKKYPQLLGKLSLRTEKASIPGKGVFYRLQAGKVSEDRAREICTALKTTSKGGCIVIKP